MTKIYGIDLDQKITPLLVRDAIVECFFQAHCADTGVELGEEGVNKNYCQSIIKKAFREAGGDFDKPTKGTILKVLDKLLDFSQNFRNPEIIKKHYNKITKLVNKM